MASSQKELEKVIAAAKASAEEDRAQMPPPPPRLAVAKEKAGAAFAASRHEVEDMDGLDASEEVIERSKGRERTAASVREAAALPKGSEPKKLQVS